MNQMATMAEPNIPAGMVAHIKQPSFPQFRFEWHPEAKKVFIIRLGRTPLIGDPIAMDIENHGAAVNAVLIYLRGYKERAAEMAITGKVN